MAPFDLARRMREGDASAWPRWNPESLPGDEVVAAYVEAARRAGEPGVPSFLRVYTHFALCESTCSFCMYFHQVPKDRGAYTRYVDHLVQTLERFAEGAGRRVRASAAYVGGGTPSATPAVDLGRYLRAFRAAFDVEGEFSFEAHPRTIDVEKVERLHEAGVNRMSMGIQSLERDVLRHITRKNAPLDSITEVVAAARRAGIVVNLDLVLGLPGQTPRSFRADVERLTIVGPDTLTLYRYQPVPHLPHEVPAEMGYENVLDDEMQALIEHHGYGIGDPIVPGTATVRLLRRDAPRTRWADEHVYALFDEHPSHLLGFGPGAYGHVFGYGWLRDVTSMERLEEPDRVYWGTRLGALDECRQALLYALANRGGGLHLGALSRVSGVDVAEAFEEPLRWAREAGGLTEQDGRVHFEEMEPATRERIVDALMPARPKGRAAPAPPRGYQTELVPLRHGARKDDAQADPALVRAWCRAVGVPQRGKRIFGAVVTSVDDRSVYFRVRGAEELVRIHVRAPHAGRSFFQTRRFAISYSSRPGKPLTDDEKVFLRKLAGAMKARAS